jgi:hypothetical protein
LPPVPFKEPCFETSWHELIHKEHFIISNNNSKASAESGDENSASFDPSNLATMKLSQDFTAMAAVTAVDSS